LAPTNLEHWLARIERLHPKGVDLGLDRVAAVRDTAGLVPAFPLIAVAGTNGKGSACALLEAMLTRAGYRAGLYSSPHLLAFNERVRIAGRNADDAALCQAFERVESARGQVSLTYFEFATLAALDLFQQASVDVAVLEVGLGGRLDAVNAFNADCALVTTVDLDHLDYLGPDREAIGREKAGIFRAGRPAICADEDPPQSLLDCAREVGAELTLAGRDYGFGDDGNQWHYWSGAGRRAGLPHPALRGRFQLANAAAAIAALEAVRERVPVDMGAIRRGLVEVDLPGRFQVLPGSPAVVLDVAHNPQAARTLAASLAEMPCNGRTLAVFAMLSDKDIAGVAAAVAPMVSQWFIGSLDVPRGAAAETVRSALGDAAAGAQSFADPAQAYAAARETAAGNDRILVFGSFYTVSAVLRAMQSA
jgi:dihydrofolate synthase / folylpolyglutamate synthase